MSEKPTIANELAALPHVPVTSLAPFQGNLKELTAREYSKLKKSLQENGVIVPFFVWAETGKLLDGHQRRRVFESEGWEVDVPVVYISADDEQDAKRKLLVISSQYGKVTQEGFDEFTFDLDGDWILETANFDALPFVFEGLPDDPEPEDAEPQISRADELREQWGTELGQLWRLPSRTEGQEHRLICGDCTDAAVVERVMGGEKAQGVITSPPYAEQRKEAYGGIPEDDYLNWWAIVQGVIRSVLSPDGSLFLNIKEHSESYVRSVYVHALVVEMAQRHDWVYLDEFCWERAGIPGDPSKMGKFKNQWEPVFWWALQTRPRFYPDRVMHNSDSVILDNDYQPTLAKSQGTGKSATGKRATGFGKAHSGNRIRTTQIQEALNHPAAFPVGLAAFFVLAYSDVSDIWYEPFSGSGTTIIAAENLSRQCRAVEISPAYVAVALQRYKDAFGIEPELM